MLQNIDNMLLQASIKHLGIHESIVVVDLRDGPPAIRVYPSFEFLAKCQKEGEFPGNDFVETTEHISAGHAAGALMCCFLALTKSREINFSLKGIGPNNCLKHKSWRGAQDHLKGTEHCADIMEKCRDPEFRASTLSDLIFNN